MNVKMVLTIAAFVAATAAPGLTMAQQEHMISGKAVPADQVTEVQAKCDALRKAEPAAKPATPAAPAAKSNMAPAAAMPGWTADGMKVDVTKLTVAMCDEGKFAASVSK